MAEKDGKNSNGQSMEGAAVSKRAALSRIRLKGSGKTALDAIAEAERQQAEAQAKAAAAREAEKTAVSFDEMANEFGFGVTQEEPSPDEAAGQGSASSGTDAAEEQDGGAGEQASAITSEARSDASAAEAADSDEQPIRPLPTSVRVGIVIALSLSAVLMIAGRTMANALMTGASIVGLAGTIVAYVLIARRLNYHALTEAQIDERVRSYRADLIDTLNGYSLQGKYTTSDVDELCREYRAEIEAENVSVADIGLPTIGKRGKGKDAEAGANA